MAQSVIVIGAGMVGVSTAIWLQRFGREVLLLDKDGPAAGASFGNAGLIAQWAVTPVTTPDLWKSLPSYMLNPNSALFLKWSYLPKMLPWLAKFLSHANDKSAQSISRNLAPLLTDGVEQHKALVAGTKLERWISDSKFSYAYKTRKDFDHDRYAWDLKATVGMIPTVLNGRDVQDAEPILGPDVKCLAVLEGQGHITNPGQYIQELTDHFVSNGGKYVQVEVTGLNKVGGRIASVATTKGVFDCSETVITAGIWSKDVMKLLGLKVPLETERGYHVIFKNPSEVPRNPMMITWGKFGVNPMDMGMRCAGTVEIGDHHAEASKNPIKVLRRSAKEAFPKLKYSDTEEWLGFRPSTYDSLPLIGEIGASGIYTGFGHQHVGVTAGPKTGRLIAQMISGNTPNLDMAPYAPDRFGV